MALRFQSFCPSGFRDAFYPSPLRARGCPGGGLYWCSNSVARMAVFDKRDLTTLVMGGWHQGLQGCGGSDNGMWVISDTTSGPYEKWIHRLNPDNLEIIGPNFDVTDRIGEGSFGVGGTDKTLWACSRRFVGEYWMRVDRWDVRRDDNGAYELKDFAEEGPGFDTRSRLSDPDGIGGTSHNAWLTNSSSNDPDENDEIFPRVWALQSTWPYNAVDEYVMPAGAKWHNLEGCGGSENMVCAASAQNYQPPDGVRPSHQFFVFDPDQDFAIVASRSVPFQDGLWTAGAGGKPLKPKQMLYNRSRVSSYVGIFADMTMQPMSVGHGAIDPRRKTGLLTHWSWQHVDTRNYNTGKWAFLLRGDKHLARYEGKPGIEVVRGADEIDAKIQEEMTTTGWRVTNYDLFNRSLDELGIRITELGIPAESSNVPSLVLEELSGRGVLGVARYTDAHEKVKAVDLARWGRLTVGR